MRISAEVQRGCIYSGHIVVVAIFIGMLIAGLIPPPAPSLSARQIADFYIQHQGRIQAGGALMMIFWVLWAPWGALLTTYLQRMESASGALTYAAATCVAFGLVIFEFIVFFWIVAAYRPGQVAADITMTLNDIAWFMFLYTWPPFSLLMVLIAVAIFFDKNVPMVFPRWVAFLNLWCAVLLFPATLMSIYKTGSFAYDGLFGLWVPLISFCAWMTIMSEMMLRGLRAEARKPAAVAPVLTVAR